MDIVKEELEGSWLRLIISIPLDVITLLFLFITIASLTFRFVKNRRKASIISLIFSAILFCFYYIILRDRMLDLPLFAMIYFLGIFIALILLPIQFADNRQKAYRIVSLLITAAIRRIFGVSISLMVLIASLPLFLIISLIVKISSAGPVLVRHVGISRAGRPITLYNFRTKNMHASVSYPPFLLTTITDPEITRFGTFLQVSGLHALPRLWSVLKGDLYLIGVSPLDTQDILSSFVEELLKKDFAKVQSIYSVGGKEEFRRTVERCLPLGLVTYAELKSYHVRVLQNTVVKDLNIQARLSKEADYFIETRYASLRLFLRLFVSGFFRLLSSFYLVKIIEARGPVYEPNE